MSEGIPYIIDRPLSEKDLFVGRHRLMVKVVQNLIQGQRLMLVYGPARIGKTSFLYRLAAELPAGFSVPLPRIKWH